MFCGCFEAVFKIMEITMALFAFLPEAYHKEIHFLLINPAAEANIGDFFFKRNS